MPMPYQLSHITVLCTRHPKAWEVILEHQLQHVLSVATVILLLAHLLGSNACRISDPQLEVQLRKQPLEPTRLSGGFDPHAYAGLLLLQFAIELFRFRTMRQPPLSTLSCSSVGPCDLLHARVIIAGYNQDLRPPFCPSLWSFKHYQIYSGSEEADDFMKSMMAG